MVVPLLVGKGAEEEITRKAGGRQALEKTEYLAQKSVCPADLGAGKEQQDASKIQSTWTGRGGRSKVGGLLERLLKWFRQEELRTWKNLAKVHKDHEHVQKTVKPWQVNRQESPEAL